MNDLNAALVDICQSQNLKFHEIARRAQTDPIFAALHAVWLIATDVSEDAPRKDMNDALTKIDRLAGLALGVRP